MGSHRKKSISPETYTLKPDSHWNKLWIYGAVAAAAGIGGAFATGSADTGAMWTSLLTAWMFAMALAFGGFFFVIIHHLVRASWSTTTLRIAEHMMFALPFVALFGFVFVFGGSHELFEWTHEQVPYEVTQGCPGGLESCFMMHPIEEDVMLNAKGAFLNQNTFQTFYFAMFVIWSVVVYLFWNWSRVSDEASKEEVDALILKSRWLAAPALILFALTITFNAFYFLMSLDPHWFSTIFGVYYFSGATLTMYAFLTLVMVLLKRSGYLEGVVTPEHFHDYGKFMFGFTVFWTYIGFSQYFLIWYADIPEETHWFQYRAHGQWLSLSLLLVFGRFVLPWFAMLRRVIKRTPMALAIVALWVVAFEFVDMYFLVAPVHAHHEHVHHLVVGSEHFDPEAAHAAATSIHFGLVDALSLFGFFGLFLSAFGFSMRNRPLVAKNNPRLMESVNHENF